MEQATKDGETDHDAVETREFASMGFSLLQWAGNNVHSFKVKTSIDACDDKGGGTKVQFERAIANGADCPSLELLCKVETMIRTRCL